MRDTLKQDGPPIVLGGGVAGVAQLLDDIAGVAADLATILGLVLVALTLYQRFRKGGE